MPEEEVIDPPRSEDVPAPEASGGEVPSAPEVVLDATAVGEEADDGFSMSESDAKLAAANGRFVQLTADFENYRKRVQREKAELAGAVGEEMLREFLPVVDNLERALAAGVDHPADGVVKGVELTLRLFQAALTRHGVERFEAKGQPFDPHRHEALAQEEVDGITEDTVLDVLEAGYVMGGRVLRPAKVRVGRPKPEPKQE